MDRVIDRGALGTYVRLNDRFHRRLNDGCGLETLIATIDAIRGRCALFLRSGLNLPVRLAESQKEHRAIFDACRRGDGPWAEHAMREHILRTAMTLVKHFGKQPNDGQLRVLTSLLA